MMKSPDLWPHRCATFEKLPRKWKCRGGGTSCDSDSTDASVTGRSNTIINLFFLPLTSPSISQLSLHTFPLPPVTGDSIHLHLLVSPARRGRLRQLVKWGWGIEEAHQTKASEKRGWRTARDDLLARRTPHVGVKPKRNCLIRRL